MELVQVQCLLYMVFTVHGARVHTLEGVHSRRGEGGETLSFGVLACATEASLFKWGTYELGGTNLWRNMVY